MRAVAIKCEIPPDFPTRIKKLRARLGLTQMRLAELMGVSFASVNRWENGQSRPSVLAWQQILRAEELGMEALGKGYVERVFLRESAAIYGAGPESPPRMDFSSDPELVRAVAEGERLTYGHLFNPTFGTEVSLIDPLPHQYIAVYSYMLPQPRLRFLLADDAGAGKTIMAGLYVREMLTRRLIHRVLVIPPAGLVGNWEREMQRLFSLCFRIVDGSEARHENPFAGPSSDLVIVSLDTLAGERTFARLQEPSTAPYDLVIFDEAHKLSADREPDFRVRKTDRYRLAEAIAGIRGSDPRWQLDWSARHLLLLTATPHMGRDFPYYCLWRLLEPEALSTFDAFSAYPPDARKRHFIRRTKEEMVRFDGSPIYPARISDTLSYDLIRGESSEQKLYDETTDYIRSFYNRARILNRSAARLAMGIFQRRLASSTYALIRSFERRLDKLDGLISDIRSGRLTLDGLLALQQRLAHVRDVFSERTADEESTEDGREENEVAEDEALGGVTAGSLVELEAERLQVKSLLDLARRVHETGQESKFQKLREVLLDPCFKGEKMIIFSEYRDTLDFLVRRLEGLGFSGQVAQIHGGMNHLEREEQVEFFRKPTADGGATYLLATDAAGEGINLQVCWLMVNYDIPWNPARLEQRMGRIHRYGQKHDPVIIMNLVAGKTREGRVLRTVLEKLERIRKELGSDKVFDVIGRLFEGVSLKEYMEQAVTEEGAEEARRKLEGKLTKEQVAAIQEHEKRLFGDGGDVRAELPNLRTGIERGELRRLLPGYVRRFIERAAPLMGIAIEGDPGGIFRFRPLKSGALDWLWPVLETYPPELRNRLTVYKPKEDSEAVFLHPGEPVFDRFRASVCSCFAPEALRGAVFVDPYARRPYMFHLALVGVERQRDPAFQAFARDEILEYRLVGLKQDEAGQILECPVEYLLLLRGGNGAPVEAARFAATARDSLDAARAFILERIARPLADERRRTVIGSLPEREDFVRRGYDYQDAELAVARARYTAKASEGDPRAQVEFTRIKERQRALATQREEALALLRREPELIAPGSVTFLAHALVVPSNDPEDRRRHDDAIEAEAVRVAWSYEESRGASVKDVSTPESARSAGLTEHPGFDLLSVGPGREERAIEVKGRAGTGDIELTENEWAKACNLRDLYWLYVVFECASSHPRLLRIRDPFGRLLAREKGGVVISEDKIFAAAEGERV
ncbi:MAG: helicase-related protein [Bacillota bacterium]